MLNQKLNINKLNKLSKFNITILSFFLFLYLSISQCYSAPCKYIIWGFVSNMDSPVSGVEVILTDVRTCQIVNTDTTTSEGLYIFWLYSGGGNYNVSISGGQIIGYAKTSGTASSLGGTVSVQENRAVRLDLDYNEKYMAKNRTEQYYDYICYVTKEGYCYHRYGCRYLYNSCIPVPYGYAVYKEQKPCSECLK